MRYAHRCLQKFHAETSFKERNRVQRTSKMCAIVFQPQQVYPFRFC